MAALGRVVCFCAFWLPRPVAVLMPGLSEDACDIGKCVLALDLLIERLLRLRLDAVDLGEGLSARALRIVDFLAPLLLELLLGPARIILSVLLRLALCGRELFALGDVVKIEHANWRLVANRVSVEPD